MEVIVNLFVDPATSPSMYWVRVTTMYGSPAYCRSAGHGSLPLQADDEGNYHLDVLLEETTSANSTNPVLHEIDLGCLTATNSDTTLTVHALLVDGGGSTGTVRLEEAEQESRPIPRIH